MRHRGQHVEGIAAGWRERGIIRRRAMQIQGHILRQNLPLKDVLEQFAIARAEHHRVVIHILEAPVSAEIPDKQAHREFRALDLRIRPALARVLAQQLHVGEGDIGVGDDDVAADRLARGQAHAGRARAIGGDLGDLGIADQAPALPLRQAHKALHQGAGAAHRVMHTVLPLQMRDQAVIGRGGEGISTDQQRMEAEGDAQLLVFKITADLRIDREGTAEADQVRRALQHRHELVEGLVRQLAERDAVDLRAVADVPLIAGQVGGFEARDFGAHGRVIGGAREGGAVVEADLVEGVDTAQVDVVAHRAAAQRPEFLEQIGRGDDGGAGIEGEAVLTVGVCTPARRIELLEDRHAPSPRTQPHRARQPPEAGADDDGVRPGVVGGGVRHGGPSTEATLRSRSGRYDGGLAARRNPLAILCRIRRNHSGGTIRLRRRNLTPMRVAER